eukprot:TRINITY_DN7604_c0_g1_i1.p1 TRINITY_DN7604_c0_g1~~TRINITY_DN7604_c0_g1_i1.p1  ORF type:complete len:371 (-),score=63.17 TRINITY_DN7604_c0_g1_i1:144-1256(-)
MMFPRLTADQINMAIYYAIPATFVASKLNNFWIKGITIAGISGAFLTFQSSKPRTVGTMMVSVIAFLVPLKATQLLLSPSSASTPTPTQQLQSYSTERINKTLEHIRGTFIGSQILSFIDTTCEFAWLLVPFTPVEIPTFKNTTIKIIESLISFAIKTIIAPILHSKMLELATQNKENSTVVLSLLFSVSILTGTAAIDMFKAVTLTLSFGRWEVLDFNRYPFLSTSLGELWSKRYNLLISRFLHNTVFVPMRRFGYSPSNSSLATFSVSGLLHVFVAYHTFQKNLINTFLFFGLHGVWVTVEHFTAFRQRVPALLRTLVTALFFSATFPLYGGLFIDAMPEWLTNNPVPIAEWSRPIVDYLLPKIVNRS